MRYRVQDKLFSIGDGSWVGDERGAEAFLLDGRTLRIRRTCELKDASGEALLVVRRKAVAVDAPARPGSGR
jgi:uncharacterized protein YxjI